MGLSRFWNRSVSRRRTLANPARPWPVDPELSRRAVETRARIERTRGELARHVSPEPKAGAKEAG